MGNVLPSEQRCTTVENQRHVLLTLYHLGFLDLID